MFPWKRWSPPPYLSATSVLLLYTILYTYARRGRWRRTAYSAMAGRGKESRASSGHRRRQVLSGCFHYFSLLFYTSYYIDILRLAGCSCRIPCGLRTSSLIAAAIRCRTALLVLYHIIKRRAIWWLSDGFDECVLGKIASEVYRRTRIMNECCGI
jgi:hypothetical protein